MLSNSLPPAEIYRFSSLRKVGKRLGIEHVVPREPGAPSLIDPETHALECIGRVRIRRDRELYHGEHEDRSNPDDPAPHFFRKALDDARGTAVGAHAKLVLSANLEELGGLVEHRGDFRICTGISEAHERSDFCPEEYHMARQVGIDPDQGSGLKGVK
jgi:hypothetical protein